MLLAPGQWQVAKLHWRDRGESLGPLASSSTRVINDLQRLQRKGLLVNGQRAQVEPRGSRQVDDGGRGRNIKTEGRHRGRSGWCHEGRKRLLVCHSGRDRVSGGSEASGAKAVLDLAEVLHDLGLQLVLGRDQGLVACIKVSDTSIWKVRRRQSMGGYLIAVS